MIEETANTQRTIGRLHNDLIGPTGVWFGVLATWFTIRCLIASRKNFREKEDIELETLSSDLEDAMDVVDDMYVLIIHVHVGWRKKHIISLIALPNSLNEIYM